MFTAMRAACTMGFCARRCMDARESTMNVDPEMFFIVGKM
jgi:hypothetical protein